LPPFRVSLMEQFTYPLVNQLIINSRGRIEDTNTRSDQASYFISNSNYNSNQMKFYSAQNLLATV